MRRLALSLTAAMLASAVLPTSPLEAAEPITGRWVTDDKDAVVEIAPCGAQLCGTIARFLIVPSGGRQLDIHNKIRHAFAQAPG